MSAPRSTEFDQDGGERPRFLLQYPRHAALDPLVTAFEVGDFRSVRRGAESLRNADVPAPVQQAAQELLRRTRPDPLVVALLGVCFFLLSAVVGWTYLGPGSDQRHGPGEAPAPR